VAFALKSHLKFLAMKNRSGKFATPGLKGILAAASSDQKPSATTNELSIVNPPKKYTLAYPISTYTYVIAPTSSPKAQDLRKFLFWAVTTGRSSSSSRSRSRSSSSPRRRSRRSRASEPGVLRRAHA
jgi:ABC-type phosphate transport system substrate-binding protein